MSVLIVVLLARDARIAVVIRRGPNRTRVQQYDLIGPAGETLFETRVLGELCALLDVRA